LIEQLSNLSTIAVVNIRDAVSEAVLSIADSIGEVVRTLKQQKEICERQLPSTSSTSSKGKDKEKENPKLKAFMKQRDDIQKVSL
jgi:hypothetical protein